MITALAILSMAVGLAGMLRAIALVTIGRSGRFPLDPWVSLMVGFGLILLGQALRRSWQDRSASALPCPWLPVLVGVWRHQLRQGMPLVGFGGSTTLTQVRNEVDSPGARLTWVSPMKYIWKRCDAGGSGYAQMAFTKAVGDTDWRVSSKWYAPRLRR